MADAGTTSSMYRDLVAGQQVEADQIVGDLVARGKAAGAAVPLLNAAYANLSVYQAKLA
jgi:2-dehydropantoate 2-reductase